MVNRSTMLKRILQVSLVVALGVGGGEHAVADTNQMRGFTVPTTASADDIAALAPFKVNIVRLSLVCPGVDNKSAEEYLAWLDEEMARLDTTLTLLAAQKVKAIVNLHTPPGGFASYGRRPQFRLFAESWTQGTFVEAWQRLATRYRGNQAVYAYQILSEPAVGSALGRGLKAWDALSLDTMKAIRKIDKQTRLITSPDYASPRYFPKFRVARGVGAVSYAFHYYQPMAFTHQGAAPYPVGVQYPTSRAQAQGPARYFSKAIPILQKKKLDAIITEFSVSRFADDASAVRYLRTVISLFEKYRWSWTFHSWREADIWSVEHSSNPNETERSATLTARAKTLLSYFAKNK